jgi:hypothetical protein
VHDVALLEEIQRKEELFGIYPDSSDVQSNILAETLNDVSEIHAVVLIVKVLFERVKWGREVPQRFEDKTEVPTMFKGSLYSDDMFFVIWIGLLEFIQHLYFFETGFVPGRRIRREIARIKNNAHMDSWHRIILMATSLPMSVGSPPMTLARTTLANMPLPREEKTW